MKQRRKSIVAHALCSAVLLAASSLAQAADGLVASKSPHSVKDTMDRFESIAKSKGMNIFARINHAAGASKVGQTLRPTELLIFGNPKGGTPLMQCSQSFAIDLPLKALAWQDESGQVWLGVNDMAHLAARHGAVDCPPVPKIRGAMEKFIAGAVK